MSDQRGTELRSLLAACGACGLKGSPRNQRSQLILRFIWWRHARSGYLNVGCLCVGELACTCVRRRFSLRVLRNAYRGVLLWHSAAKCSDLRPKSRLRRRHWPTPIRTAREPCDTRRRSSHNAASGSRRGRGAARSAAGMCCRHCCACWRTHSRRWCWCTSLGDAHGTPPRRPS